MARKKKQVRIRDLWSDKEGEFIWRATHQSDKDQRITYKALAPILKETFGTTRNPGAIQNEVSRINRGLVKVGFQLDSPAGKNSSRNEYTLAQINDYLVSRGLTKRRWDDTEDLYLFNQIKELGITIDQSEDFMRIVRPFAQEFGLENARTEKALHARAKRILQGEIETSGELAQLVEYIRNNTNSNPISISKKERIEDSNFVSYDEKSGHESKPLKLRDFLDQHDKTKVEPVLRERRSLIYKLMSEQAETISGFGAQAAYANISIAKAIQLPEHEREKIAQALKGGQQKTTHLEIELLSIQHTGRPYDASIVVPIRLSDVKTPSEGLEFCLDSAIQHALHNKKGHISPADPFEDRLEDLKAYHIMLPSNPNYDELASEITKLVSGKYGNVSVFVLEDRSLTSMFLKN